MRKKKLFIIVPLAIVGMVLFATIGGQVVKLLWNWLLPPLFGWPHVTFWQALGLLALCRILFGGFGRGGSSRSQRWQRMSPEEREHFRQRMRERWGFAPHTGETPSE